MIQINEEPMSDWPINAMNLKEILENLEFENDGEKLFIKLDNPILKAYPVLLEDDGMGYGINEQFISEVDSTLYENHSIKDNLILVFNMFKEKIGDKWKNEEV